MYSQAAYGLLLLQKARTYLTKQTICTKQLSILLNDKKKLRIAMKARIKETGEIIEVIKVGNNQYLDKEHTEIYNHDDLIFEEEQQPRAGFAFVPPEVFLERLRETIGDPIKEKKEILRLMLEYEMELTLEIVRKRPFMSPKRIRRRVNAIMKHTVNDDE